jgi:hypothetical protein
MLADPNYIGSVKVKSTLMLFSGKCLLNCLTKINRFDFGDNGRPVDEIDIAFL